ARGAALAVRPLAAPAPARTIALVWRRRSHLAPALRELAAVVRESYPADILPRPWRKRSRVR
ncbi:MAG TPA: hypothetical protein VL172_08645, partial [Kofleriaceae bacterium]|nr:hypothetical protein [Kofleriaceae bacterium]